MDRHGHPHTRSFYTLYTTCEENTNYYKKWVENVLERISQNWNPKMFYQYKSKCRRCQGHATWNWKKIWIPVSTIDKELNPQYWLIISK